jgi:hypothetical protein
MKTIRIFWPGETDVRTVADNWSPSVALLQSAAGVGATVLQDCSPVVVDGMIEVLSWELVEDVPTLITTTRTATTTEARESKRESLRQQWAALPAWINGPFHGRFLDVQDLLNDGRDKEAEQLVVFTDAPGDYTSEQLATFAQVKAQLAASIAELPS